MPARMAPIKCKDNPERWHGRGETGPLRHGSEDAATAQLPCGRGDSVSKTSRSAYGPAAAQLNIYFRRVKTDAHRETRHKLSIEGRKGCPTESNTDVLSLLAGWQTSVIECWKITRL